MTFDAIQFLRAQEFIRSFRDDEVLELVRILKRRVYAAGEVILTEDQPSSSLYFLCEGEVEVLKHDERSGRRVPLSVLRAGAVFGEVSFLEERLTSATIHAVTESTVLVLPREELRQSQLDARLLYQHLTSSIASTLADRLRATNQAYVASRRSELEQSVLRTQFARFFVVTVILFGIASLVPRFLSTTLPPSLQMAYSWGFLAIVLVPTVYYIRKQGPPLAAFGLTLQGWRKSLEAGAICSIGLILAGGLTRWVTQPELEPFLTWGSLRTCSTAQFCFFFVAYLPHCLVQELVTRGLIQGSLRRFMADAPPAVPVLVASAVFGVFHVHVSISFAIVTFLVSLVLGSLYARHPTLLGVTATHFAIGAASIAYGFN